jgi:hypothetical protein
MRKGVLFKIFLLALCVGAFMLVPVQARAEEPGVDDSWQFAASLYLWGIGIDGKTQSDTEVSVDFDDILDNLKMAFLSAFEARKGKWSLLADVLYLDVGAEKTSNVTIPIGPGIDVSTGADLDLKAWAFHIAGGYNLLTKGGSKLDLVAGARYLDLQMDLALSSQAIQARYRTLSASNSVWDGIIGLKGNIGLSKRWYLPCYLDIGTGESDYTWQAIGGIGFRAAKWVDVTLVYRHLAWNFGSDRVIDDLSISGPIIGAIFRF